MRYSNQSQYLLGDTVPATSFGRIARITPLLHPLYQPLAGTRMARSANESDVVARDAADAVVRRAQAASGFGEAALADVDHARGVPDTVAPSWQHGAVATLESRPNVDELLIQARFARDRAVSDVAAAGFVKILDGLPRFVVPFQRLIAAYLRRRAAHATYRTLRELDARTLRDIGIDPSEIRSVAAELSGLTAVTRRRLAPAFCK